MQAIEAVADALGNTKAVCRKCYIHPEIVESYLEGELGDFMQREGRNKAAEKAVAIARIVGILDALLADELDAPIERINVLLAEAGRIEKLKWLG